MPATAHEQDEFAPRDSLWRVLIVERDPESVRALRGGLAQAGFAVTALDEDEDALAAIDRNQPHLVMLDWEHPAVAAHSLIRRIQSDAPAKRARLIALSLHSSEQEIVSGFELGVDDYVVRPYSLPVLLARVRAVLRTGAAVAQPGVLQFHALRLDLADRRLMIGALIVTLRPMEYRLIEFLIRHPERVFSREQLLRSGVWSSGPSVHERAVDVTVQRTRKALERHGCGGYLQTVRAVGYILSAHGQSALSRRARRVAARESSSD